MALIPYIIQEDGFYYVAYKEKVKVPYVVGSAKGVANGLSEEYNDGWDFGPDSYDPTSTSKPPYTQTSGIQEAVNYLFSLGGGVMHLNDGVYDITNAPFVDTLWEVNSMPSPYTTITEIYCQLIMPAVSYSDPTVNISIIGNSASRGGIEGGQPPAETSGGVVIRSKATPTGQGIFILGAIVPSKTSGPALLPSNINLYIDGITFMTKAGSNMGGLVPYTFATLTAGSFYITNDSTSTFPTDSEINSNAALLDGNGAASAYQWRSEIGITGYQYAWFTGGAHISIGKLMVDMCVYGIYQFWGGYYSNTVQTYDVQNTKYFISTLPNGNPSPITTLVITNIVSGDQKSSGYSYDYEYVVYDQSNSTYKGGLNMVATLSMYNPDFSPLYSITEFSQIHIKEIGLRSTPTIPTNPPATGTVYQNTNPYDITIDLPVYASTSGTAGYVTIAKGSTDTPTAIGNQYVSGDTSSTATQIIRVRVPAGWYYEFTGSGVTFATATPFAE
ncbi:hypothetical protein [Ferrimicrobium sp.]|uniref:hypothetical protein n=1 Tax=Ferrimicrobium sp. TaxID=2926050 RepID=UPI0026124181|nr:hypothetical protein [Ferrimicrobium sp.]